MKNTLDLILERLESMTCDEIVNATDYSDNINYANLEVSKCNMVYNFVSGNNEKSKSAHKIKQEFKYNSLVAREKFEYSTKNKNIYRDELSMEYRNIKPMAA